MKLDIKKGVKAIFTLVLCAMALTSCDDSFFNGEGDCDPHYRVKFRYDYNMKYADAFAHEVNTVTLYLLDANGNIVYENTESGAALAADDYAMTVDIEPGTYNMLVWCGTADKQSFEAPQAAKKEQLTRKLKRKQASDGKAIVDTDIDRLFHGYVAGQVFERGEGMHTYTVPLVKDTNNVRVVLQQLSGEPVDKDNFDFTITDDNGFMNWDNKLMSDATLNYKAWRKDVGSADIETGDGASSFGACLAEFTISRLVTSHNPRLTVTNNRTGEIVFSIPLKDYCLMVKGFYNRDMADQEYLDRQDEYNMVFFLDDGMRWISSYIYINSWKVVLQNSGI